MSETALRPVKNMLLPLAESLPVVVVAGKWLGLHLIIKGRCSGKITS